MANYTIRHMERIDLDDLSALDLQAVLARDGRDGAEAYRVTLDRDGQEDAERGQLLWYSDIARGGVCLGADSDWTDASDPEDAVQRVLDDNTIG